MQGWLGIRLICALLQLQIAGCFSGDQEYFKIRSQKKSASNGKPMMIYQKVQSINKGLDLSSTEMPRSTIKMPPLSKYTDQSRPHPAMIVKSVLPRVSNERSIHFVTNNDHQLEIEKLPIPEDDLISVAIQMDVKKLNITLLRIFREGIAAALGLLPQQVHINHLNDKTNCIEFYISSVNERSATLDPIPSDEVMQSLNVNMLHQSLSEFGITQVTPEKKIVHGEHGRDGIWNKEGVYAVVIFLTAFVIVITCLMEKENIVEEKNEIRDIRLKRIKFLYRLKEKLHFQINQDKQQHQSINLSSIPVQQSQPEVKIANSMVQPGSLSGTVSVNIDPQGRPAPEIKPCVSSGPSPFKMKSACLQERRGSNVSLTLDMSTLGNVESLSIAPTPREKIFLEYLQTASRVLTRLQLSECVANAQSLQAEFMEIPMNFVNPKELNIPCHGAKNRYKTILPNPHSRVCLIPKSEDEPVSNTYINANYIRGYGGQQRAYIATQGPMINTVNDFWRMVWQEDCPVIVMITKLKEKNEKCVLYWPEKRGIYGKVEVLVNSVTECEHYVIRDLTLKHEGKCQNIKHYWYKSWPDHKTPDSAQPLLQLMLKVEETRQKSPGRGPVVVHCSAGIGRTGCFIAITIGCHQLKNEGVVDILSIVCQLRMDRGGMIQTSEQYGFVHHALSLYGSTISADTRQ
ncbi:receptor-type tyrosine-protein phosphatase R-like isoform X2 [Chiloscyllium plagiosum]|uniref:receptor-type tyrosine-protein phosphatase R-like isoform X2 n=1 Tax=Chiloscyllium plagiosum TaxID=36176 RepID=UPI001CB7C45D|nr:receptor-type tyrosine-protein phosphatase R-like isoform X2 [Chiloscyllium plagiosum]